MRDRFQIMRGVACMMVLFSHLVGLLAVNIIDQQPAWLRALISPAGFPWVWMFLVLSGFLLTKGFATKRYALSPNGITAFYRARAKRLMPMMWFAGALWLALFSLGLWPAALPGFDWWRELNVAAATPWVPYFASTQSIASMNSPVWSAVIEVHFSIGLPILLLRQRRLRWIALALAAWAVWMVTLAVRQPTIFPMIYGAHLYNVGFFLAGAYIALAPKPEIVDRTPWWALVVLTVASLIVLEYACEIGIDFALAVSPLPMLLVWAVLVWKADNSYQATIPNTLNEIGTRSFKPMAVLETLGMMSYSIYLLHKPLGYLLIERSGLSGQVHSLGSLALATAVIVACVIPLIAAVFVAVERGAALRLLRPPGVITRRDTPAA